MKKLNLFQHTYKSMYSVYNITNFLDDKYLELLLDKTISLTEKDSMNRNTNVQANMTKYNELLKHQEYKKFFSSVCEYLTMFIKLRESSDNQKMRHHIFDAWGMQHFNGDYTRNHNHGDSDWSFVFYLRAPATDNYIHFDEFDKFSLIKANDLYIFPGLCKHAVNRLSSNISRVSLSANIKTEYLF